MNYNNGMDEKTSTRRSITLRQVLPYLLLIGGIIGVFCAGMLTVEKMQLLKHPGSQLSCDLNPIVACGSVINTKQASAFGFPNPLIGLVGFGILATIGAGILAGATFKRWFWLSTQVGVLFAVCFITWLQFETIYRINALCPFCMVVWSVTIPTFIYVTFYNLREGHLRVSGYVRRFTDFLQRHHGDILVFWYLVILAAILQHFWYYWKTVL